MSKKTICKLFGLLTLFICLTAVRPVSAEASSWQQLEFTYNSSTGKYKTVKVGNYTFKYSFNASTGKTKVSVKKGSGSYKSTPFSYYVTWTDGKTAYYVKDRYLYKYNLSKRKNTKLKKLPATSAADGGYSVSYVYSDYVYLTYSSFDQWKYKTYCYNTKKKSLKMVKNNCTISVAGGKYCVCEREYRSQAAPVKYDLFKITGTGSLKKVKTLSKACMSASLIDDKFYYTKYEKYGSNPFGRVTLYRCKKDGSNAEKLGTFKSGRDYGMIYIVDVTSSYCTYRDSDENLTTYYYK